MKTKHSKIFPIPLILFILLSAVLPAKSQYKEVIIDKTFEVNSDALLSIDHEYGKLSCKNWDKNAISVNAMAVIVASDKEEVSRILKKIDIDVDGNTDEVQIECNHSSSLFNNGDYELVINIDVFMPPTIRLDLDHQFGKVYIEDVEGQAHIQVQHGMISIGNMLGDNSELEMNFGKAEVGFMASGEIRSDHSEFTLEKGGRLQIESEFTQLNLGSIQDLEVESEGGYIRLDAVQSMKVESELANITIGYLGEALSAETEFGSLTVKEVGSDFDDISVESSKGSIKLVFTDKGSFRVTADVELGQINYPEDKFRIKNKNRNMTSMSFEGIFGQEDKPQSSVSVEGEFGNIIIEIK